MRRIPSGFPEWLVTPPLWAQVATVAIGVIVAIAVAVQLAREDWRVSLSTQREMQVILASILGITTVTVWALRGGISYPIAVVIGATGHNFAVIIRWVPEWILRGTDDPSYTVLVSWWALFALAFLTLFNLGQATYLVGLVAGLVAVLAMLWALYMTAVQNGEVQIDSLQDTDQR